MKKKPAGRPPMFEVRHSQIHGYGVFALRRIRKGTIVIEYLGDRISHDEADSRYEDKPASDSHTFLFTVDAKTVIDGGVGGNDARYINHGCVPNCESTTTNKRVFIEAIRTIQKGEELAYDYQIQRDPGDPANVDEVFACRCGAVGCRGSMLEAPKRKTSRRLEAAKRDSTQQRGDTKRRSAKQRGGQQRGGQQRGGQRRATRSVGVRSRASARFGARARGS